VFDLKKYFIMEDDCQECRNEWKKSQKSGKKGKKGGSSGPKYHFDLWMGPVYSTPGSGLIVCEDALTKYYMLLSL